MRRFIFVFSSFSTDPEFQDSMLLMQRYSLEPFMTPHRFFYPWVVIEFYHTMTSRRVPHPTALHFSIDGRPGILKASEIAVTFNFPVVLANSVDYRQWPHPLPREMDRLLSGDITAESVLFRRHLPPCMLLIDHILRSNLFPLQHTIQRRGAILEALFRISEGHWFSPVELIMTSLFHFEDKVHRRSLSRAKATPFLFPRLLCQVLEHLGFLDEPRLGAVVTLRPALPSIGGGFCPTLFLFQLRTSQLLIFLLRSNPLQWSILGSLRLRHP